MTDDGAKALGLRALEAGFRWAPGCMARRQTGPCFGGHRYTDGNIREGRVFLGGWPDFRDPATLGVLLGQFVAAWQPTATRNGATDEQWRAYKRALLLVARWAGGDSTVGDELAEALVAALEAAR